jgi:glycosyltransferase involved in cell wall biosynthesis
MAGTPTIVTPVEPPVRPEESGGPIDVSVVVAITGEARDLEAMTSGLADVFRSMGRRHEIIFVDDGSAHFQEMKRVHALHPEVRVFRLNQVFGESVALSQGFERARGSLIVTMPPYLQVEPGEIAKIVRLLDEGYDFVSGWRHPRVDPILNRVQSSMFNLVTRVITRSRFHDLNCNVRGMKRKVVEEISIQEDLFRFLPLLAERQGFRVAEVKLRHRQELGKAGFFGFGVYIRRFLDILTMFFVIKFLKRPLRFFGLFGSLFFGLGLLINAYLTIDRLLLDTPLADRPLLILGVLLMVLGFQTISIGLIGEIIIFTHAKSVREYQIEKSLDGDGSDGEDEGGERRDPRPEGGHHLSDRVD